MENLDIVLETINQGTNAQFTRTNILEFIIENDYFTKLINVFNEAENNENANVLYNVSDIVKSLFLYNESDYRIHIIIRRENFGVSRNIRI